MGFIDKILEDEADVEKVNNSSLDNSKDATLKPKIPITEIVFVIVMLLIGLAYRLFFIYKLSVPENAGVGWYGDTYHHWQIAYLTMTQGFSHGFLRLWDLKGMEFFWGPLDPLLTILAFKLTGSINIVIMRYISMIFGLGTLYVGYLLSRKFWGKTVALSFVVFGVFFPVAVFNDVTGSLEPIGVFLILLAIYFSENKELLAGILFALSTMVRAEAWMFSIGIILAILFGKKTKFKALLFIGWFIPMILYMKYLLDYTGNPIYPVWWNYLANGVGVWAEGLRRQLTPLQIAVRPLLITTAVAGLVGLIYNLVKRPKGFELNIFGWGNIFFVGVFMGLTHYLTGWEWWFPIIRFFVWPYLFLSILIFAFLGHEERKHIAWKSLLIFSVIFITVVSQFTWLPIMKQFATTVDTWDQNVTWGKVVGKYYQGGTLLFIGGEPNLTYTVVKYGGVSGEHFLSEMFDPYYYAGEDNVMANWPKYQPQIFKWIKDNNIRLAVFRKDSKRYMDLVKREPQLFELQTMLESDTYQIYRVFPDRIVLNSNP